MVLNFGITKNEPFTPTLLDENIAGPLVSILIEIIINKIIGSNIKIIIKQNIISKNRW